MTAKNGLHFKGYKYSDLLTLLKKALSLPFTSVKGNEESVKSILGIICKKGESNKNRYLSDKCELKTRQILFINWNTK